MTKKRGMKKRYMYAGLGVDTNKALETLKNIPISMHCWQGDDVTGFDHEVTAYRRDSGDGGLSGKSPYTGRVDGGY